MSTTAATVQLRAGTPLHWTWEILTPIDPARFYPKFGPIPATVAVRDQTGPWNVVGQSRRLILADGGHVIETITDVREDDFFAYELTDFQKLFRLLVDHARAEWTFSEQDGGTLVHWTYAFTARRGWGWAVALIVRLAWEPYMRQVLPEIVHEAERLAP
jgi:hypothetical protein